MMTIDVRDVSRQLGDIVGAGNCSSEGLGSFALDGLTPRWRVSPGSAQEIASILDLAQSEKLAVLPRGSGTKFALGAKPSAADILLDTCRLDRIVDYDAPNLTVTVQAGVTLGELQHVLAAQGNFLPLDAPLNASTIGGVIATNSSGPKRLLYGSARDVTLGISAVLTQGGVVNFGGKVMKNVAGYDMTKLLIGSFGTLGVTTQVTFRLLPLPETARVLVAGFSTMDQAASILTGVLASQLSPSAIELFNAAAWRNIGGGTGRYYIAIGLEGFHEAVDRQVRDLIALGSRQGAEGIEILEGQEQERLWSCIRDFGGSPPFKSAECVGLRIGMPISKLPDLFRLSEERADELGLECAIGAHAGTGVLKTFFINPAIGAYVPIQIILELRSAAEIAGGHLVVEYGPWGVKEQAGVWGGPRPEWELMRQLKAKFDPNDVLNPGRFVGGI